MNIDPLFAAVIHDAKNALLALDTQLGEAERRPADANFSVARATTARIAGQLTELLTLYRAQQGQLRLAVDDHDLADFFDDVVSELGPLPAGLTLACDRAAALQIGAWAFDAYLLKLVLLDALRNAGRHARRRITLGVQADPGSGICFSVADDGPGFPETVLIGAAVQAGPEGTGLGLAFARLIAARHVTPGGRQGRVELANHDGAHLRIHLP